MHKYDDDGMMMHDDVCRCKTVPWPHVLFASATERRRGSGERREVVGGPQGVAIVLPAGIIPREEVRYSPRVSSNRQYLQNSWIGVQS